MNSPDQPDNVSGEVRGQSGEPLAGAHEASAQRPDISPVQAQDHQGYGQNRSAQRNHRLGAALRENLKRRKMQARGRRTEQGAAARPDASATAPQD